MKSKMKSFQTKLVIEAILKSALVGIAFGFAIGFILAFIFYFAAIDGVLLILILSSVLAVGMSVLLYFFGFKPSNKHIASRIDSVGLDERVITMLELEGEDSVIANKQREDAKVKMEKVTPKQVKFSKLLNPLIAFVIVVSLSVVMITQLSVKMDAIRNIVPDVVEKTGYDKEIENMINDLKDVVDQARISSALKADLHAVINDLEDRVYDLETDLQKLAAFSETKAYVENKIIDALVNELKDIVDNADADKYLKDKLYLMIDQLEIHLFELDSYKDKISAIDKTRQEILKLLEIIWISDELQKRESTVLLGDAIETRKPEDVDKAINYIIDTFVAMPYNEQKEHMLLTMIEDLEDSLAAANEDNDELRAIIEDLIEILRKMLQVIIIEGDIPKATEEMDDELKKLGESLKDYLSDEDDGSTGSTVPGDDKDKPVEAGKQTVIDGKIYYEEELEQLINGLNDRIANDLALTDSDRAALSAYLANIIRQITEQEAS